MRSNQKRPGGLRGDRITCIFDGYPAILVRLDDMAPEDLDEVIVEAWLARAPTRLAEAYLARRADERPGG